MDQSEQISHLSASILDFDDGFIVEYFKTNQSNQNVLNNLRLGLMEKNQDFGTESSAKATIQLSEENFALFSIQTKFIQKWTEENTQDITDLDEELLSLLTSDNLQVTITNKKGEGLKSPSKKMKSPNLKKSSLFKSGSKNNSPLISNAVIAKVLPQQVFPFVGIVVGGVTFMALPLIVPNSLDMTGTQFSQSMQTSREYPAISGAFCFLQDLASNFFLANQKHQKVDELTNYLHMYLSQSAPYGRPIDTAPSNVHHLLTKTFPIQDEELSSSKRPAWKAHNIKFDQQRIHFIIRENVLSAQFDKKDIPDELSCFGSVLCSAEIDGFSDVTVSLSDLNNIKHMAVHYCCRDHPDEMTHPGDYSMSISFSPPAGAFVLCKYNIAHATKPPVRGYYQMRELADNKIEFLLQLAIDSTDDQFDYCNVLIPFPNRSDIVDISYQSQQGQLTKGKGRNNLVWAIGNRWKTKELSMSATVTFNPTDSASASKDVSDPFFVNKNALVRLQYKLLNSTVSGIMIDPKTISLNSTSKLEGITVKREIVSEDCVIYNSRGDVRHVQ